MKNVFYSVMIAGFMLAGNHVYAQANIAAQNTGDLNQAPGEVLNSSSGGGVSTPYGGGPSGSSSANDHRQQGGGHVTVQDILGVDNGSPAQSANDNIKLTDTPASAGGSGSVPLSSVTPQGGGNTVQGASPAVSISIYPNPTTDGVNVVTEGEIIFGVVEVIDLTGKTVKKSNTPSNGDGNSSNIYLSLSELKAGMYLIRFQTDKNIYVKRIQVK